MDGNGRWAKENKMPRISGHRKGVRTVQKITKACGELGIKILTLYTFSSENWHRPEREVKALMALFVESLKREIEKLMENNVKFTIIGNLSLLPDEVIAELLEGIKVTNENTGLNLNLAFSYGSQQEIVMAMQEIGEKIKTGILNTKEVDEKLISNHLYTKNLPNPDLLIRTGGEYRISNFLLWQLAYSELYFTDKYWPDFSKSDLIKAIEEYQFRERRFGRISSQFKEKSV